MPKTKSKNYYDDIIYDALKVCELPRNKSSSYYLGIDKNEDILTRTLHIIPKGKNRSEKIACSKAIIERFFASDGIFQLDKRYRDKFLLYTGQDTTKEFSSGVTKIVASGTDYGTIVIYGQIIATILKAYDASCRKNQSLPVEACVFEVEGQEITMYEAALEEDKQPEVAESKEDEFDPEVEQDEDIKRLKERLASIESKRKNEELKKEFLVKKAKRIEQMQRHYETEESKISKIENEILTVEEKVNEKLSSLSAKLGIFRVPSVPGVSAVPKSLPEPLTEEIRNAPT